MQMERVIHLRLVDDVPYLQFADADRVGVVMGLAFDLPLDAMAQAHTELELHGAVRRNVSRDKGLG